MALIGRLTFVATATALTFASCSLLPRIGQPAQFVNRVPLPACGQEIRGQGDGPDRDARACLLSAFKGHRSAEFASSQPTIEGDPIITYYRVWPSPEVPVEVFRDSSRDQWGTVAWTRDVCDELVTAGGDAVFELSGCLEQPQELMQ